MRVLGARYRCTRAYGIGDCTRPVPTQSDPRETSGPRIDRIPPTRPPWWRRQYRDLKKLLFLAPSKCPIDLFGPVANGRMLKRLHAAFRFCKTRYRDCSWRGDGALPRALVFLTPLRFRSVQQDPVATGSRSFSEPLSLLQRGSSLKLFSQGTQPSRAIHRTREPSKRRSSKRRSWPPPTPSRS